MGYSLDLFLNHESINSEYICSICQDVLRNPVMLMNCEHVFCNTCINQWSQASTSPPTCPVDRQPMVGGIRAPFLYFMNLYNSLAVKCTARGCNHISTLGEIQAHYNGCVHNPNSLQPCRNNCGGSIKMKDMAAGHNCIEYLKGELEKKNAEIASLREDCKEQAKLIHDHGICPNCNSF